MKQQITCMKAHINETFYLQHAIHAIILKLRTSKQKATNITPFEAHFDRKCNTPASKIATKSYSKTK